MNYAAKNIEYDREGAYIVVHRSDDGRYHGLVGGARAIKAMYGGIPDNACLIGEITYQSKTPGDALRVIAHQELAKLFAQLQAPTLTDVRAHDVNESQEDFPLPL